jgi:O-antigen ligase
MSDTIRIVSPRQGLVSFIAAAPRSWFWLLCTDLYPALTAASLPWSTTGVAVFMVLWFITLIPTLDRGFLRSLRHPACLLPLAFLALALVGMLWADGPLSVRLLGVSPVTKLLVIPFLLYHFQRSQRGHWVLIAFLISCALLMGLSWATYFAGWKASATGLPGVPVKNYIDQSHEFALCLLAAAPLLLTFITGKQRALALGCAVLLLGFFCSMMFVATARTVIFYLPGLLIVFALRYLSRRLAVWFLAAGIAMGALVWFTSPYVRDRVERTVLDYKLNRDTDIATSHGERLAYWRTSIRSIAEAPLFGHGTGATKQLFAREAEGKSGEWANMVRNPHNQTLYVAIQWGVLGCIVLYAMWYFHLRLFRGSDLAAWIGLVVVVQNIISSLFNSHLFDFHEGWIYVLGVGVAGGMTARAREDLRPGTHEPVKSITEP